MVINQIQAQEKAYHSVALLKDNKQTKNDDNKTLFIEIHLGGPIHMCH